jgi:hypothetical protein
MSNTTEVLHNIAHTAIDAIENSAMTLRDAIITLKQRVPMSEAQAQTFLDSLPPKIQKQIICAIYAGRDHINSTVLTDEISVADINHIPKENYAHIISDKSLHIITYLNTLEVCATNSKFNLNNL